MLDQDNASTWPSGSSSVLSRVSLPFSFFFSLLDVGSPALEVVELSPWDAGGRARLVRLVPARFMDPPGRGASACRRIGSGLDSYFVRCSR